MSEPRVMTADEVRAAFLDYVSAVVDFWEDESRAGSLRVQLDGVVFSILAMLDGEAVELPGFRLLPHPHESDEAYHRARGNNWYPSDVDIAGSLHEEWARRKREAKAG